jgi:hypothetical protein
MCDCMNAWCPSKGGFYKKEISCYIDGYINLIVGIYLLYHNHF